MALSSKLVALSLAGVLFMMTPASAQRRRGGSAATRTNAPQTETPIATFAGTVRTVNKKQVVITTSEDNALVFHVTKATECFRQTQKIKEKDIEPGEPVIVDGVRDMVGDLEAKKITIQAQANSQ